MADTTTLSNTDIAGYAKRFENIMKEQDTLAQDMKELAIEAKEKGIDVPALKAAIKQKIKPTEKGFKEKVNYYMNAMGQSELFSF